MKKPGDLFEWVLLVLLVAITVAAIAMYFRIG